MHTFSVVLCAVSLTLLSPLYVSAQGLAVKVQPSMIDEVVDAGQVLEGAITVTNENGGTQTYFISTRTVTGMNDTGTPSFSDEHSDDPLEVSSWIKPIQDTVTINVGESVTIPYRIEVPGNASPGGYFGAFFVTREADKVNESGAGVGFHVASLVNLRVKGEVNEDMLFREFSTNNSFFTKPSVTFTARIENSGTIHQRPMGIISISNMFGKEVGQIKFNENGGAILPRTDRFFEVVWDQEGFALGRYTAVASIGYGETKKNTLTKEITFWIIPVREVGFVIGGIIAILLAFILGVRSYVQRALRRAGQSSPSSKSERADITFAKRLTKTMTWLIVFLALLFVGILVYSA